MDRVIKDQRYADGWKGVPICKIPDPITEN
jgi:hypothetical protein